jgi:hypothetical protein
MVFRPEAYRKKQRDKFRRFSAEAPREATEERRRKFRENRELDSQSKSNATILDKAVAEKLFKRHLQRVEQNHN